LSRQDLHARRDGEATVTFDEFLNSELAGLRKYSAVLTGDTQRAQDVLADGLLRAHTRWSRIGAMEFPAAYVRRIVTSEFLSEKRRWSVRMIRPTRTGDLPEVLLADPAHAVEDRALLAHLLAALPPRQRAALVLRYYLGLDTVEVAAELGITAGAVRTAISRGLAALRIAVADENPFTDAIPSSAGCVDEVALTPIITVQGSGSFDLSPARAPSQEGS
jgi:RNA polymerase sigma-70 factor (sigma-E family)